MHIAWKRASPRKYNEGTHLPLTRARARPTFPRSRRLVHLLVRISLPQVKVSARSPPARFHRRRVRSTRLFYVEIKSIPPAAPPARPRALSSRSHHVGRGGFGSFSALSLTRDPIIPGRTSPLPFNHGLHIYFASPPRQPPVGHLRCIFRHEFPSCHFASPVNIYHVPGVIRSFSFMIVFTRHT